MDRNSVARVPRQTVACTASARAHEVQRSRAEMKSVVVAIALLAGCATRAAPRASCGVGWSALTVDKTPEARSGVEIKNATMIERVEIAGVAPHFAKTLRRELRTKPGETVMDAPLGDDLRRLWKLGVIADASVELDGGTVTFV